MTIASGTKLGRYEIRAQIGAGDTAKARKSYQDFLALWKDADPDIPVPQEAKREYETLGQE